MKSKKTLMGMVLLIGVLVLGIGYAAISTINLTINGTASAAADGTFVVQFDDSQEITKNEFVTEATVGKSTDSTINDLASFTVEGMNSKGDTTTIVFPVTSEMEEDLQAALAVGEITNDNEEYFEVSAVVSNATLNATTTTSSVTVTVTLIKTPLAEETATIKVPLTATPSQVSGN